MDESEKQVWHVRRAPNASATYLLFNMVGLAIALPLFYYLVYLLARHFDKVFTVFFWFCVVLTLGNLAIYRGYRKYPGKVFRHPTIGHAIHEGVPSAKLYSYGHYFCLLFLMISADDSPLRVFFSSTSGFSGQQWFLFVVDNAIKAIIFDFAEIYGLQFSNIKPVGNGGKTIMFVFRTLLTISFFDFMLSINKSWKTDRLMLANLSALKRDMKLKEVAEYTLIVAPVQIGSYQPLYPSKTHHGRTSQETNK